MAPPQAPSLRDLANVYLPEGDDATALLARLPLLATAVRGATGFDSHDDVAVWVKRLNTLLRHRSRGYRLLAAAALRETLDHVDDETFSTHAVSWTAIATQLLVRDGDAIAPTCLAILRETLRRSRLHPELRRAHGADGAPAALHAVLATLGDHGKRAGGPAANAEAVGARGASRSPEVVRDALDTLAACAGWYPGPTRAVTDRVRRIATSMTGSSNHDMAAAAVRCLAALPRAAAAAQQDEAFSDAFCAALQHAHASLDSLYAGADERDMWRRMATGGSVPGQGDGGGQAGAVLLDDGFAAPIDDLDSVGIDIRRFTAQAHVIVEMLTPSCRGAIATVPVPVDAILGLATRCIETDADTLPTTRRGVLLLPLLPEVHLLAVELAVAVVGAARAAVRRHASTVLALATAAVGKRSALVRSAGFQLCADLLREAGPSVNPPALERVLDLALAASLADDRPDGHDRPKHAGSGGQVMGGGVGSIADVPATPARHAARATVCRAAMGAIEAAILVAGAELSRGARDRIDAFLLSTALAVGRDPSAPYADARCRIALFRAFRAAVMSAGPGQPTCLPHAVGLCSELLHDDAWEVRLFARESMAMLDQLVRPRTPSVPRSSGAPTVRSESQQRTSAASASSAAASSGTAGQSAPWRGTIPSLASALHTGGYPNGANAASANNPTGTQLSRTDDGGRAASDGTSKGDEARGAAAAALATAPTAVAAEPRRPAMATSVVAEPSRGDQPKRKRDDDALSAAPQKEPVGSIAVATAAATPAVLPVAAPTTSSAGPPPPKTLRTDATASSARPIGESPEASAEVDGEEEDDGLELPMFGDDGPDSDDALD